MPRRKTVPRTGAGPLGRARDAPDGMLPGRPADPDPNPVFWAPPRPPTLHIGTSAVGYGVPGPFHAATPFCQNILGLLADHLARRLRRTYAISRCYPILPKYFGVPRRPPRPSATAYRGHFTLLPHFAKLFWGSSPTTSPVGYGVPRPFHAATPFCQNILGLLADHPCRRLRRTSAISRCSPIFTGFPGGPRPSATAYLGQFTLLAHFFHIFGILADPYPPI